MRVQLPAFGKASRYFYSMQYNLARDEQARVLNPHQQAYLLLDNGLAQPMDCVQTFRKNFDRYLSDIDPRCNGM